MLSSQLYRKLVRISFKGDLMYFSSGIIVISIIGVLLVGRLVKGGVQL